MDEDPELVQLLDHHGQRREHERFAIDLTADEALSLYRDMVLVRRFDAEATALQRQGELGLWPPSLGQEASQVGSGRALLAGDYAFPTYREHGVAWTRGVDPVALLALFRGVTHGGYDPQAHGFALSTIVIGDQTLHAVGYAMGLQRDVGFDEPPGSAVIAYFGDGAASQGDVNEALLWASIGSAPVVFFCQNNQWAISAPLARQSRIPLYKRADGFGFPGVRVDGNDVIAVLAVTRWALERARAGEGPTLIEAFTYRMGAHTTSDDPTRYRTEADLEQWRVKDPIERLRRYLEAVGVATPEFFAALEVASDEVAERVRRECRNLPNPSVASMFDHVYAEPHRGIDEQRTWWRGYLGEGFDEPVGDSHG